MEELTARDFLYTKRKMCRSTKCDECLIQDYCEIRENIIYKTDYQVEQYVETMQKIKERS